LVAPANAHELSVVPELLERTRGVVGAERNYWSSSLREQLARWSIELAASYRTNKHDPNPKRSACLRQLRYRIDTVFSQLTERYPIKRGANDLWRTLGCPGRHGPKPGEDGLRVIRALSPGATPG
jgi:hypothetical protein